MSKAINATLALVVSLFLFSTLTTAETAPSTGNKKQDTAHHSRLAKAAFWRHHDDAKTKAKPAEARSTTAKSQKPPTKRAQLKPVSAKVATGKHDQKPQRNSNSRDNSKTPSKKAPVASKSAAANKTKSQQKTQTHETASLQ